MKTGTKKKLSIREELYLEDLIRASRMSPEEKLKTALEISNLCFMLREAYSKTLTKKRGAD